MKNIKLNTIKVIMLGVLFSVSLALELPDKAELSKTADCPWFTISELPPSIKDKVIADVKAENAEYLGSDGEYSYIATSAQWGVIGETVYFVKGKDLKSEFVNAHKQRRRIPDDKPPPLTQMAIPLQYILWWYSRKDSITIDK